ncbi:hypothetical protein SNE40_019849 [Patella caerulea]|uniref:Uncharacterized protein n=1 Tax=Patella caerulea TaxID=87958 RepID=A0AAN8G1M5_PATCE
MANFNDNRKIQVSDADILHLQTLKDSPISYLVSSTADSITTPIGQQLIGSPLAYHVCNNFSMIWACISFSAKQLMQNRNINNIIS